MKGLIKLIAVMFVILLAAVVVIPLVILAGLFIWLKLTEEADDEALDLEADLEAVTEAIEDAVEETGAVDFRHSAGRRAPSDRRRPAAAAGQLSCRLRRHDLARRRRRCAHGALLLWIRASWRALNVSTTRASSAHAS